ncbi:MAG: pyridoxal phosphate-dependent aminotransferase [Deltaproteobacteria bacterium]|nr:pyridoxal phosphate-dependent aminotransferase [Deltaproteobacteria bacterium]
MFRPPEQPPLSAYRSVPRTGVIFVMAEAAARGFRYGHADWVNLGQGAPETGPLPDSTPRLDHVELGLLAHEYSPVGGLWELREAVASLYNQRYRRGMGSQYSAENVAIASGGRVALSRIAAALDAVNLGHILPDYTAYAELLETFDRVVPIPIAVPAKDGFYLSPTKLRDEIVGVGLGAVLLSNPCNPTGRVIRGGELRAWIDICRELGCQLIFDEFYAHYLYDEAALSEGPSTSAARYVEDVEEDPVVLVDGLTKNWRYPGWRLSWTIGPRALIERVTSAGSYLDGGAPHPLQVAAIPLLDRAVADQEARAIQAAFALKRRLLVDRAQAMGMQLANTPMGAFYGFVSLENLPESLRNGMDFFRAALDRKVIVVPGEFFDVDPGKRRRHIPSRLRQYIRLSFGPSYDSVKEGLTRLDQLVRDA